jgi:hypothetical protein
VLIAVTATDEAQVASSRRTFADYNAVFIGQAQTEGHVVEEAERWIAHPLAERAAEVIIADVVVALRHVCSGSRGRGRHSDLCELPVVDRDGAHLGDADDLLIDSVDDSAIRYVVVGHGGILGIARKRYAVPGELLELESDRIRLKLDRTLLLEVPEYDAGTPFSRKDELNVHQFFGTRPYWLE